EKYQQVVNALLLFVKASGSESHDAELLAEVDALDCLARATESASIERGLVSHTLASAGELDAVQQHREATSVGEQDFMLRRFAETAPAHLRADYFEQIPGVRGPVERLRNEALGVDTGTADSPEVEEAEEYPFNAQGWFEASSNRISVLRSLQET